MIKAIAAINMLGHIGKNGDLMYHIPKDLAYFKKETVGHVVIMGRKTYESLPTLLSGRTHVVVTNSDYENINHPKNSTNESVFFGNPDKAMDIALWTAEQNSSHVFVIGGSEIYSLYANQIEQLHLTWIMDGEIGDSLFPAHLYREFFASEPLDGGWYVCEKNGFHCQTSIYLKEQPIETADQDS